MTILEVIEFVVNADRYHTFLQQTDKVIVILLLFLLFIIFYLLYFIYYFYYIFIIYIYIFLALACSS